MIGRSRLCLAHRMLCMLKASLPLGDLLCSLCLSSDWPAWPQRSCVETLQRWLLSDFSGSVKRELEGYDICKLSGTAPNKAESQPAGAIFYKAGTPKGSMEVTLQAATATGVLIRRPPQGHHRPHDRM